MTSIKSAIAVILYALLAATVHGQAGTANIKTVTCGSNAYSRKQVDEAVAEGCRLYKAGQQLGSNNYPHRFNNRESLVFAASGPYQEFPILTSGNYTGRSPGADRIVFSESQSSCGYVGAMTHTNAPTNNGFVLCIESKGQVTTSSTSTSSPTRSATAGASSSTKTNATAGAPGAGLRELSWGLLFSILMIF